ncbi:MAG: hypothetical protein EBS42_01530 [Caulobacteraceae bacterium]|nr:hypothetical protein [Caulobacteraceae bacterium]
MADGFDIHLDEDRARRLAEAATMAGQTPEAFALSVIDEALGLSVTADLDWAEDMARLTEYDRTGVSIPLDDAMDHVEARIRERAASRS